MVLPFKKAATVLFTSNLGSGVTGSGDDKNSENVFGCLEVVVSFDSRSGFGCSKSDSLSGAVGCCGSIEDLGLGMTGISSCCVALGTFTAGAGASIISGSCNFGSDWAGSTGVTLGATKGCVFCFALQLRSI